MGVGLITKKKGSTKTDGQEIAQASTNQIGWTERI